MNRLQTPLLFIILLVVCINLFLTLGLYQDKSGGDTAPDEYKIPSEMAMKLAKQVVELYNQRDFNSLYELFDEQARLKLDKKEFQVQLLSLHSLFGEVETFDYRNQMKLGEKQHEVYYQLFYAAKVSNDKVGDARLILSVIVESDNVTLYGVRLNASQSPM